MTDPALKVHEVLATVMGEIRAVAKKERNAAQGFNFRGIDAVTNAVAPILRKHRVVVVPHQSEARYRDVSTSTGKPSRECTVLVTYRIHGPAGDYLDVQVPGEAMDHGDKGTAKAMSVAFRIALLQALCLPTDDRDPDHDVYERGESTGDSQPLAAGAIRDLIKNVAKARNLSLHDVAADFQKRTGERIDQADTNLLEPYLADLREHGIRSGE